jgi:hypothetical protein
MIPSSPGQAIELFSAQQKADTPKQTEPKGNCMIVLDLHTKQKQRGVSHCGLAIKHFKKLYIYIYIFP